VFAVVALVALRLGVGWQFFSEGADKLNNGFDATGFLANAKGPFAPFYTSMVWDKNGLIRLNYTEDTDNRIEIDQTLRPWDQYRVQIVNRFEGKRARRYEEAAEKRLAEVQARADKARADGKPVPKNVAASLAEAQEEAEKARELAAQAAAQELLANATFDAYEDRYVWFFAVNEEDIDKYFNSLGRKHAMQQDPVRHEVASLKGQRVTIEGDIRKDIGPILADIDTMWAGYERDMNLISTAEQREQLGYLELERPQQPTMSIGFVNRVIPWFDFLIGALLIVGLFTRVAAVGGAFFLCTVVLSQFPTAYDAAPTIYQLNILLALLVLAATGAGRFFGLDFLLRSGWVWIRSKKQGSTNES